MKKFLSPMLASDYNPNLLRFPLIASAKIDGIRCVIGPSEHTEFGYEAFTRSGKSIRNRFIQENITSPSLHGLDGELVVGEANAPDVYNRTSSGVMSGDGEPDFKFWVFDLRCDFLSYAARHRELCRVVEASENSFIRILPQVYILNEEELDAFEAKCLEEGFEGIMIRDPQSIYKYGRSTAKGGELLKIKRISHDEAEIVGFVEKMTNGNEAFTDELGRTKRSSAKDGLIPADTLGSFVCRNRKKWELDFNVAPGVLTHAEGKEIWDRRESWIGRTIAFKHLAHGAKDRPRHGRYKGIRDKIDL